MKLAKQIILLSAALVLAMGLAFTCISGIVIGTQTSVKSEKLTAEIAYTTAKKTADDTLKTAKTTRDNALAAAEALEGDAKTAAINAANETYDIAVAVRKAAVLKAQRDKDIAISTAKKAAYKAAFWYTSKTTHTDGGVINATATAEHQRLTPMALMLVSGLSMIFIGGGLVLTVVLLNKNEAKKAPAPKAAKAA